MVAITCVLAVLGGIEVQARLTDGTAQVGQLELLTNESAALVAGGQSQLYPLSQLDRLRFSTAGAPSRVSMEALTTDGSRITIGQITTSKGTAHLDVSTTPDPLTVPQRSLRAVRLMDLAGASLESWNELTSDSPQTDVVVIQRKDGRLQPIEGTLGDIDASTVHFQFDGDWIDVRRTKVAGVLYVSHASIENGLARGRLAMRDGGRIQLQDLQFADNGLTLTTPNGTQMHVLADEIRYIDFAAVSTVYLSDLEPERMRVEPLIQIDSLAEEDAKWLHPQRDRTLSRRPLSAVLADGEHSFSKGLGLHSRTELVYRLAGDYRRFRSLATVDDPEGRGQLSLVIETDGTERFRETLTAGEAAREIDIDLTGANRLRILVDYGDQNDQGDQISLCDARFLK